MREVHLECKPDEAMAMCLGIPRRIITHHNDKGRVCKKLKIEQGIIGMVDQDPGAPQPHYLLGLENLPHITKYGLIELVDRNRDNVLIIVCPRLEDWIVDIARRQQIKLREFGLPDKPNDLHKVINTKLDGFKRLIEHLMAIESEPIMYLKRLLNS